MVKQDAAGLPLPAGDVLLHGPPIAHMGHISHVDRRTVDLAHRHIIERQSVHRTRICANRVLRLANLGRAGGYRQVLRIDGKGGHIDLYGVRPFASKAFWSRSTMIWRATPP